MGDLISIVVPVYNVDRYLNKCVETLVNQTYKNIEILLINDGSTDNSSNLCNEWIKRDNRIRVFHKKNGGLSDARNYGIEKARGKYISFIDSDDYIKLNMLSILHYYLIKNNADISIVSYLMVDENYDNLLDNNIPEKECISFTKEEAIKELFHDNSIGNYAWNKLYKKSLFKEIKFPVGKKMEDIGTMYLLFEKANKIIYNPSKCYYYVQREGSILHDKNKKLIQDKYELSRERFLYINSKYPGMIDNKQFIMDVILRSYFYLDNKRQIESLELLSKIEKNNKIIKLLPNKKKIRYYIFKLNRNIYWYIFRRKGM